MTEHDLHLCQLDGTTYTIQSDGTIIWYLNGEFHRENGPAIIYNNGIKVWYQHGKLHHLDGPSVEYPKGKVLWHVNGHALFPEKVIDDPKFQSKYPTLITAMLAHAIHNN